MILILILILIIIMLIIFSIYCAYHRVKEDTIIKNKNKQLESENLTLQMKIKYEEDHLHSLEGNLHILEEQINTKKEELDNLTYSIKTLEYNKINLSKNAFKSYCNVLELEYEKAENNYNKQIELLHKSYKDKQNKIAQDIEQNEKELSKLKATKEAIVAAFLKEEEIKKSLSFYCLTISEDELEDIKKLNKLKENFNKPRIISMLVWSTYFQKPMTSLCNNIVGKNSKTGIYKITNQLDGKCYIGQSLDISSRFKEHAKCGLGIDTPAANKLYKAMLEDGIWNFSWEIVEECSKEELNEKEKFYIDLYQSYNYGYNSNAGIGKIMKILEK